MSTDVAVRPPSFVRSHRNMEQLGTDRTVPMRTSPRKRPHLATLGGDEEKERALCELAERCADIMQKQPVEKPKHVLPFFEVTYKNVGGQQCVGKCMFCNRAVHSTGAGRLLDHLLECPLVLPQVKTACHELKNQSNAKRKVKCEENDFVLREAEEQMQLVKGQKKTLMQQGIRAGFKSAEIEMADRAIAQFFYANGLPFSVADPSTDSYYVQMVRAIQAAPSAYVPPNRFKLAGPLLETCHELMLNDLAQRDPEGLLKEKFGVAYTQDGWDSVDSLPLINSAYVTANDGGIYQRSVDTSGFVKDAEYIASLMISDIYSIGCTHVVMVVTDTCATMQKAWLYVEDEFPWISCIPCVPHVVSLLAKDIGKSGEVASLVKEESTVVSWFSNHQKPLAILRAKVQSLFHGKRKELVKAGATRFGTHTLVGQRLQELKTALQQTVVDPEYVAMNYKDLPDAHDFSNAETTTRENKGGTAKKLVLDDPGFWKRVDDHVKLTTPVLKLLRRHDSSAPTVGKVYHGFFTVGEHFKSCSNVSYQAEAEKAFDARWVYGHTDFFSAAYMVDPEYQDHDLTSNKEVSEGFLNTLEKLAVLVEVRRLQKLDGRYSEQWKKREQLIRADKSKQQTFEHYPKYPDAETANVKRFCASTNAQLALFRGKKGVFARSWLMESAEKLPAYLWWDQNGSSVPELQTVARMILAQPGSASICERINSEFAFIKDRRRNGLQHGKANKLVGLFHNLRLMKRMKKVAYAEPAVAWSADAEHTGIVKFGVENYA